MTYNKPPPYKQRDEQEKKGKKRYRLRKQIVQEHKKEIKEYANK